MRTISLILSLGVLALAIGCAPADVAGNYTAATTTGLNECDFDWWTENDEATAIPVVVTQNDDVVQLDVGGLPGGALDLVAGSSTFNGNVGGSHVSADLIGDVAQPQRGECAYTLTLELDADQDGDVLEGEIVWRAQTNGHADCAILATCENVQAFNANRPPTE